MADDLFLTEVVLETGADGRAAFRERPVQLDDGTPAVRLSAWRAVAGLRWRVSPVGYASDFHCTEQPQWVFVVAGAIEIELRDGRSRRFGAGGHFLSADTLPPGASFDAARHGHRSRQVGASPLVTVFVRVAAEDPPVPCA